MTTEKTQLLGDINSYQSNLVEMFSKSEEKKQLVLQSHSDAEKTISDKQSNLLNGLGFVTTKNIQEYDQNRKNLEKIGLTMETIDDLQKIKETYGKNIIGYNQLCDLCKKYNLYFGDSKYFTGKIPMENIKELEEFPFGKFASHYSVLYAEHQKSIITGNISATAKAMIVAPLNLFKLNDVFISNSRELIHFNGIKSKCIFPCAEDPIVILPFKAKGTKEVFFIIITHWDNSTSII